MKIQAFQRQTQKTSLAPAMRQSIEILLLPCAELELAIEQQVQDNPLLEYDEEQKKEEPLTPAEKYLLERFKGMSQGYKPQSFDTGEEEREEKTIANVNSLSDYLLQQLRLEINTPSDLQIGEFIIGDLNEDGYLKSSCPDIAAIFRAPLKQVERVLQTIQDFEPSGIAARDLKECLLNQAKYRFNGSGALVMKIIRENLDALSKKRYNEIARNCQVSEDRVKELVQMIASLEPKPARNHQPVKGNIYVTPDITVYLDNEKNYQIRINQDFLPALRINKTYQRLLEKPNLSREEMDYIKEKIKNAVAFIKGIEQRHETIRKISEYILEYQREFFEHGPTAIKPLTLKDVAQHIDRNESTVCRAINHKYMDTPHGLLPLKYFFSQALSGNDNENAISNRRIKEELQTLIDGEDKTRPLSDQQIVEYFKGKGIPVARRTIAKYRKLLRILPSNLRKE